MTRYFNERLMETLIEWYPTYPLMCPSCKKQCNTDVQVTRLPPPCEYALKLICSEETCRTEWFLCTVCPTRNWFGLNDPDMPVINKMTTRTETKAHSTTHFIQNYPRDAYQIGDEFELADEAE